MFYLFLKIFIFPIIRFIWIGRVVGIENIPNEGGVILAANHCSYFDFICLAAICSRRIYFLAAEKFWKSWFWKPLVKWTGQIKVERNKQDKSESKNKVLDALNKDKVIGIFPEGTRSRTGELQKFYPGVIKLSRISKSPIIAISIRNTYAILPPHKKIPKLLKCDIFINKPKMYDNLNILRKDIKKKYYLFDYDENSTL